MPILVPSAALASARAAGREGSYATSHLWLYMPTSVGDVVHQEVLRQRRRGHDRHLVVEGHQVSRQLPVVCSVGLVQDLSMVRQRVTSREYRAGSGVSDEACHGSPDAIKVGLAANSAKRHRRRKKHHFSYIRKKHHLSSILIPRDSKDHATRRNPHTHYLRSEKSYRALLGNPQVFLTCTPEKKKRAVLEKEQKYATRPQNHSPPPFPPAPT